MTWHCVRGVRLCIRKRFFIQGWLCTGAGSQRYGVILGAVLCSARSWILMIFPNSGYSMILWFYVWNKTMKIRFWMSPMKCTNPVRAVSIARSVGHSTWPHASDWPKLPARTMAFYSYPVWQLSLGMYLHKHPVFLFAEFHNLLRIKLETSLEKNRFTWIKI